MSTISNYSVLIIIFLTSAKIFKIFDSIDTAEITAPTDTGFTFLVTGGYRPPKHTLTKYLVSIRTPRFHDEYFGDNHICGGCIIGPRIILTAAHCLTSGNGVPFKPRTVRVVAKTQNRLVETGSTLILDVRNIRVHPSYNPDMKNFANDIAIAKLNDDIDMDGRLAAIIPLADNPPVPGTHCTAVGWGRILNNGPIAADPIYVDIDIHSYENCSRYVKSKNGQICASNLGDPEADTCSGDSGGPLICDLKLVGLVSYGFGCASGVPSVYTDVWFYRKWIEENRSCRHAGSIFFISFFASVVIVLQ